MAKFSEDEYRQFFNKYDTSGDGLLSPEEFRAALKEAEVKDEAAEKYISAAQIGETNNVTINDFLITMGAAGTKEDFERASLMRAFKGFDTDGSKFITTDELKQILLDQSSGTFSYTPHMIENALKSCDADNDGKINFEEFTNSFFA